MVRGVEIRLTGAQPDNILAGGAQFGDPGRDGECRGGFDALYPVRKRDFVQVCFLLNVVEMNDANHTQCQPPDNSP